MGVSNNKVDQFLFPSLQDSSGIDKNKGQIAKDVVKSVAVGILTGGLVHLGVGMKKMFSSKALTQEEKQQPTPQKTDNARRDSGQFEKFEKLPTLVSPRTSNSAPAAIASSYPERPVISHIPVSSQPSTPQIPNEQKAEPQQTKEEFLAKLQENRVDFNDPKAIKNPDIKNDSDKLTELLRGNSGKESMRSVLAGIPGKINNGNLKDVNLLVEKFVNKREGYRKPEDFSNELSNIMSSLADKHAELALQGNDEAKGKEALKTIEKHKQDFLKNVKGGEVKGFDSAMQKIYSKFPELQPQTRQPSPQLSKPAIPLVIPETLPRNASSRSNMARPPPRSRPPPLPPQEPQSPEPTIPSHRVANRAGSPPPLRYETQKPDAQVQPRMARAPLQKPPPLPPKEPESAPPTRPSYIRPRPPINVTGATNVNANSNVDKDDAQVQPRMARPPLQKPPPLPPKEPESSPPTRPSYIRPRPPINVTGATNVNANSNISKENKIKNQIAAFSHLERNDPNRGLPEGVACFKQVGNGPRTFDLNATYQELKKLTPEQAQILLQQPKLQKYPELMELIQSRKLTING